LCVLQQSGVALEGPPFQSLQFLVRDWSHFTDIEEKDPKLAEKASEKYLQDCFKERKHDDAGLRERIKMSYDHVSCSLLPHPGKTMIRSTWDGNIEAIDRDFVLHVNHFIRQVFGSHSIPLKRSLIPGYITSLLPVFLFLFLFLFYPLVSNVMIILFVLLLFLFLFLFLCFLFLYIYIFIFV
jgi:hypothetical protein